MATTYTLISSSTVGSGGASSIIFSNIPQIYTDLVLKWSLRSSTNAYRMNINITYNSISSGYSNIYLSGQGAGAATSASNATGTSQIYSGEIPGVTGTANTFGNGEIYIPNYRSSNFKNASIYNAQESNQTSNVFLSLISSQLANTAAINQIVITPGADSFAQHSTAYLYGISNA